MLDFDDLDEAKIWMIQFQFAKGRELTPFVRADLSEKLERLIERRTGNQYTKESASVPWGTEAKHPHRQAAELAGMGHNTYEKAKKLIKEATEEVKEQLRNGETTIGAEAKKLDQKQKIEMRKTTPPAELNGEYDLIYIDPPSRYDFAQSSSRSIENQYPTMSLEELKELKAPAAKDCVMYMWVTDPKTEEALELIDSWGFVRKSALVWDKEKIGMGYWFRSQHEYLWACTKGSVSPPDQDQRISSVFKEARTQHSRKPEYFYEFLEESFPWARKIELFARNEREGWESWGNEIEKFTLLESS